MIVGLDSLTPPTPDQVQLAKAAGIGVWHGWLGIHTNAYLPAVWTQTNFQTVQTLSPSPVGFVSGWDDPLALKALGAAWGVRPCLLVQDGIRTEGSWVGRFLTDSGAGLAGPAAIHHWTAPFHILIATPGYDPQTIWNGAQPDTPNGWQWSTVHQEFGADVNRGWYHDWFLGDDDMFDTDDRSTLTSVNTAVGTVATTVPLLQQKLDTQQATLDALQRQVQQLTGPAPVNTDALASALVPLLAPHLTDVATLATQLAPLLAPSLPPAVNPLDIATAVARVLAQRLGA